MIPAWILRARSPWLENFLLERFYIECPKWNPEMLWFCVFSFSGCHCFLKKFAPVQFSQSDVKSKPIAV